MIGKKSDEIFREESIQVSHKHVLKFKQIKTPKQLQYDQIRFLVNLKACRTSLLLRLYLKKIALARDIFVLDISQGGLFEIPKEINQSNLPQSYSYYDHLYNYIQEHMDQTIKELQAFKCHYRIQFHVNEKLGQKFIDNLNKDQKLSIAPKNINYKESKEVDYRKLHFSADL